jgi:hypothetical protein
MDVSRPDVGRQKVPGTMSTMFSERIEHDRPSPGIKAISGLPHALLFRQHSCRIWPKKIRTKGVVILIN